MDQLSALKAELKELQIKQEITLFDSSPSSIIMARHLGKQQMEIRSKILDIIASNQFKQQKEATKFKYLAHAFAIVALFLAFFITLWVAWHGGA